jgi:subtilase family serine protease
LPQVSNLSKFIARVRFSALLIAALLLVLPGLALAQGSAVQPRITDRVNTSVLTTLQGNTHPLARAQFDQGGAPPNLPMDRILLVLKRSPDQEAALQSLLEQQQDTSSPNYHKWLTPDQFGQQFGPADADVQAVTSWLSSYGFQSIQVSKGRSVIEFSGTAAQVENALHTSIHRYVVNGESHWANASDPQVPTALAPVIGGVVSLHDFRKTRLSRHLGLKTPATSTTGVRRSITFTDGTHGLGPADFGVIYNVASNMTGANATIAIVSNTDISVQDVHQFRSIFGLPANDPQIVVNGPDPGDLGGGPEAEAVLDATWAGAVAPNATVELVVSEDTNDSDGVDLSELYIVDYNLADVMTESIATCEAAYSFSAAAYYGGLAEQAAAQGITYLVASGDGGPDGCDDFTTVPASDTPASVNLLAATPFTIAVGGTEFNDTATPSQYWNSTNGANSESAKSYIPENVWNESCTVAQCGSTNAGLYSSGGGQSVYFAKPSWQSGVTGIPSANARFLPDVSLTAADHDGYTMCLDGSCQGTGCPGGVGPCFAVVSGTSASVQAFGGVMALVVQKTGARQGQANYVLYKLAANETLSSCNGSSTSSPLNNATDNCIFNDVTTGNTNIPGETGFAAGVGYDEATGLGSVNVSNLVNQWSSIRVNGSTTTLSLNNGNSVNITHGTSVPVSITVAASAPATGTPTGDVSLISSSTTFQGTDGFTLSNGAVNSSTIMLPGGTYGVTAHYEGDAAFNGSNSTPPINVTVTPEATLTAVGIIIATPCTGVTSVPYGGNYILSVGVTDSSGAGTVCLPNPNAGIPSGTVTLTDTFNGATTPLDGGTFKLNSAGYFEDQTIQLPAGVHSITASYGGDNSYKPSTSTTDVVTVTQAPTSTSIAASQTTVPTGTSVTFTATVNTQSNATANSSQEPTGTVQFFLGGAAFGAPVAVMGGVNSATGLAQAIATKSSSTLANGQNVVTAQYLGDSNYAASAISSLGVTVTVGSTPGINLSSGCSNTITITAPGQSGTCLITVTGANSFAGTVNLSAPFNMTPPSATDLPTCSFGAPDVNFTAPSTITLSSTSTTGNATLTCNTTAASGVAFRPANRPANHPSGHGWPLVGVAFALTCLCFLLVVPMQRRWRLVPLAGLLAVFAVAGVSCGGSSSGSTTVTIPGTTTGQYTILVTATPTPSSGTPPQTAITINVQ